MQSKFPPRVWLDNGDLEYAQKMLDLGDSTTIHISLYPHKIHVGSSTNYISEKEHNAIVDELKESLRIACEALDYLIDRSDEMKNHPHGYFRSKRTRGLFLETKTKLIERGHWEIKE